MWINLCLRYYVCFLFIITNTKKNDKKKQWDMFFIIFFAHQVSQCFATKFVCVFFFCFLKYFLYFNRFHTHKKILKNYCCGHCVLYVRCIFFFFCSVSSSNRTKSQAINVHVHCWFILLHLCHANGHFMRMKRLIIDSNSHLCAALYVYNIAFSLLFSWKETMNYDLFKWAIVSCMYR